MTTSRRSFIKTTAMAGSGALLLPGRHVFDLNTANATAELYTLCTELVNTWGAALLRLQVTDKAGKNYGGIVSPDSNLVPGRCGDAIYPFFYLAHQNNDQRYHDAATILYQWMENTVSQPDGSWLNEPVKGSWKGITVFTAMALAETLKMYGHSMNTTFKVTLEARLKKAGDYIRDNFTMDYGNINYPISATYTLSLLGELLSDASFTAKGKSLAQQSMKFITQKDGFIYGEGTPYYQSSRKGCYGVDLGYNVEESLPSLVLYARLTNDKEMLEAVTRSLHTHLEFMLPDGAWDNSWGTRNFKWTYWGSRTSDGCAPAFALLGDKEPVFYKAALANTTLLKACTKDGLLYGGPHVASHGLPPYVHHTFCHIKSLVTVLTHGKSISQHKYPRVLLPREKEYGIRSFDDVQTWLIAKGKFRATVTGYDREYKETKNGHPTGGALSLLWHEDTGPLLAASMNEYQLFEAGNMTKDTDPLSMPLTPRIELRTAEKLYMNISDLNAVVRPSQEKDQVMITTVSSLVDKDQLAPATGAIQCRTHYNFSGLWAALSFSYDRKAGDEPARIIIPVISKSGEQVTRISPKIIEIKKEKATVRISANQPLIILPASKSRVFNFVPGLEAVPLAVEQNEVEIVISVMNK